MARAKPIDNPVYTEILLLISKGYNSNKVIRKKLKHKDFSTKLSNISMKLQILRKLGFIDNQRFRSVKNSPTSKYEINVPAILKYILDNYLHFKFRVGNTKVDKQLQKDKQLVQSIKEHFGKFHENQDLCKYFLQYLKLSYVRFKQREHNQISINELFHNFIIGVGASYAPLQQHSTDFGGLEDSEWFIWSRFEMLCFTYFLRQTENSYMHLAKVGYEESFLKIEKREQP